MDRENRCVIDNDGQHRIVVDGAVWLARCKQSISSFNDDIRLATLQNTVCLFRGHLSVSLEPGRGERNYGGLVQGRFILQKGFSGAVVP
jgi:hypothetical protein